MRKVFLLFLFLSMVFSSFYIKQINVEIHVNKDGTAKVVETVDLIVEGDGDVAMYNAYLSKQDLASWSELIGSGDIKIHVNRNVVNIKNLEVRPQPLYGHNPLTDTWKGRIIISYDAYPYYNSSNGNVIPKTGIFSGKQIRPRVVEYSVNKDAFSFRQTLNGDYILEKNQRLVFYLPDNSVVFDINPIPRNMNVQLPATIEKIVWEDTMLVDFSLTFRVEKSLDEEIIEFFDDLQKKAISLATTPEGLALVVMVASILITYVYLNYVGGKHAS